MWEWLTRYPPDLYRSGELLFATSWPAYGWWLLLALVLLFVAVTVWTGQRSRSLNWPRKLALVVLQSTTFGILLLLLANPVLQVTSLKPGVNSILMLIDDSRSMSFADQNAGPRIDAAREIAATLERSLRSDAEVELFRFAEAASRIADLNELRADGPATRLRQSLTDLLSVQQQTSLAAVIVISDGADGDAAGLINTIADTGVPVHTVGLGALQLQRETLLADLVMPAQVPVGSQVRASLTLRHGDGGQAVVRVRDGSRLLAATQVELPVEQSLVRAELTFPSGGAGIRDLVFEVVPEGPDSLRENNQLRRLLSVVERQRSAIYLEGEPRWEYKFLRRAISADEHLTLKSYLKISDRKSYRQGVTDETELSNGLPQDAETLFRHDLVVIGSMAASELTAAQHQLLSRFVAERGGSLLLLAGRNALADGGWDTQPLADLLPVQMLPAPSYSAREGAARPARSGLTDGWGLLPNIEGSDGWSGLPPLVDYQALGSLKPAARTVLEFVDADTGRALPLLVTQPYGLGTVAVLASASTWRWQMRTPEADDRHGRFWRALFAALAGQAPEPVYLQVGAAARAVNLHVRLRDDTFQPLPLAGLSATVISPAGLEQPLVLHPGSVPGAASGSLETSTTGVHQVAVTLPDGSIVDRFVRVGGGDREYQQPLQNSALLRRLALDSGGSYWTPDTVGALPDAIRINSAGVRERQLLPLWSLPLWLLLLLMSKSAEWMLRRRWGRL